MKIVHVSIADPFIDGWGYQVNLLAKYLQNEGVQNYVIASANNYASYLKKEEIEEIKNKGNNYILDGVIIKRIPTRKISDTFSFAKDIGNLLEEIKPDLIFHHNFNCTSMPDCARYAKKHHVLMVCDNHADTINMSNNKLWVWFNYKFLIRFSCKIYQKQIFKAYGVTHSRCDFIHDFYGLPNDKIDFLPIGADVDLSDTILPKNDLRRKYGFSSDDFIVVSGGKMGKGKRTDNLIHAADELRKKYSKIVLVLFGRFEDSETEKLAIDSIETNIQGWCDRTKTLELLKMSDVACWPYHHTTLVEDAVSVCTPLVCRKTGTTEHLINGNGLWVRNGEQDEIMAALEVFLNQDECKKQELVVACETMRNMLSYHTVARKLLDDISKYEK